MTDEEFVFRQIERERKRDGRGTFNKVRQGGKHVRFPSDNMSAKEKRKMNGEVKSYDLGKPMSWRQFKEMPDDLCQTYLNTLFERYRGVSLALIGESMGVDSSIYGPYFSRHNLKAPSSSRMNRNTFFASDDGKRWIKWASGCEDAVPDVVCESVANVEKVESVDKVDKKVEVQNIAALLQMLQGTGAKLTIEISL